MKEQATTAAKSTLRLAVNPETPKHLSKPQRTEQRKQCFLHHNHMQLTRKLQIYNTNYQSGDKRTDETPTRKGPPWMVVPYKGSFMQPGRKRCTCKLRCWRASPPPPPQYFLKISYQKRLLLIIYRYSCIQLWSQTSLCFYEAWLDARAHRR